MPILQTLLDALPAGKAFLNEKIIERFAGCTKPRPHAFSLWSPTPPVGAAAPADGAPAQATAYLLGTSQTGPGQTCYTSWPGLVDRGFTGRHLPARFRSDLPDVESVMGLLRRRGNMMESERSSVLFCFFAQWFTDSFLRTHPLDKRRNTSNHEIDLCQIYGLDEHSTWALREKKGGRLKTRRVGDEEYPPLLYKNGALDPELFDPDREVGLSYLRAGRAQVWEQAINGQSNDALKDSNRRDFFYAAGLDRSGSTIAYSAFSTIFIREHNRIAEEIARHYHGQSEWDDDRIFETARAVNIRQILAVVVNDYIRHLGGIFSFELDPGFAERRSWYRSNRISIEFNLLYRWHSLIPDTFHLADGIEVGHRDFRFNNHLLEEIGIEKILTAASRQKAGRYGLYNTPDFMDHAERGGLAWAREFGVRPFNDYRERFGLRRYDSIDELVGDATIAQRLKDVYGENVDDVEFAIGLLAEARDDDDIMPQTVIQMVAYDAFTHILTNPLLASEVHHEGTFSVPGWKIVQEAATIDQIVARNVKGNATVSFAA